MNSLRRCFAPPSIRPSFLRPCLEQPKGTPPPNGWNDDVGYGHDQNQSAAPPCATHLTYQVVRD